MLWLTKGVSIRLLARTAGRTWVRCCSGRTVRNNFISSQLFNCFSSTCDLQHKASFIQTAIKALLKLINILAPIILFFLLLISQEATELDNLNLLHSHIHEYGHVRNGWNGHRMLITIEHINLEIRKHVTTSCSGTKPFY